MSVGQTTSLGLPQRNLRGSFTESRVFPPPRPAACAHTAAIDIRPELTHGRAAVPADRSQSPVQLRGRTEIKGETPSTASGSLRNASPQRSQRSKSPQRSQSMRESRQTLRAEIQRMKTAGLSSVSFPPQMPSSLTWGANSAAARARASANAVQDIPRIVERSPSRQRSESMRTRSMSPIRQHTHAGTFSAPPTSNIGRTSPQRSQSNRETDNFFTNLSRTGSTRLAQSGNGRSSSWQEAADGFLLAYKAMTAAANNAATVSPATPFPTNSVQQRSLSREPSNIARTTNNTSINVAPIRFTSNVTPPPQVPPLRAGSWNETYTTTLPIAGQTNNWDSQHVTTLGVMPSTVAAMTNAANIAALTPPPSHSSRSIGESPMPLVNATQTVVTAAPTTPTQTLVTAAPSIATTTAFANQTPGEKTTITTRPEKTELQQAGEVATKALSSLANLALASIRSMSNDIQPKPSPQGQDRARMLSSNLAFRPGAPAQSRQFSQFGSTQRGSSPSRLPRGSPPPRNTRSLSPCRSRDQQIPGSLQIQPQSVQSRFPELPFGASPMQQRSTSQSERHMQQRVPSRPEERHMQQRSPSRPESRPPPLGAATTSTQRTASPHQRLASRASFVSAPSMQSFAAPKSLVFPPPAKPPGTAQTELKPVSLQASLQLLEEAYARSVADRGDINGRTSSSNRTPNSHTAALQPPAWNLLQPTPTKQLTQNSQPNTTPKPNGGESRYLEQLRMAISRIEQETTTLPPSLPPAKAEYKPVAPQHTDCDPRIQAMYEATTPNPEYAAGQEEPDWADVVQYWRGVGGTALRSMGLSQDGVRNLGLV